MSNVLANAVIFSMLKCIDPHTVRGRSTLKVGKLVSKHFKTGCSCELNSKGLTRIKPEVT